MGFFSIKKAFIFEVILSLPKELQKNRVPLYFLPSFPWKYLWYLCIKMNKLTLAKYNSLYSIFYTHFTGFSNPSFFYAMIQYRIYWGSFPLSFIQSMTVSIFPCLSWPWQFWRILVRYFIEYSSRFFFSWCFVMVKWGVWIPGKTATEVKSPPHHVKGVWNQHDFYQNSALGSLD